MKEKTFPSVLNADKIAYRVTSEWDYGSKGNAPLSVHFRQFETYGDGLTQHSGDWPVQFADLTDACLSLTKAIVADPFCESWGELPFILHEPDQELLRFILTIQYEENKERFFNLQEKKFSGSHNKIHDKRWERIESWMDGKPASCLSVALNQRPHADWLDKLAIADDLRTLAGYPCWEDYFKPVMDLKGDWHQAFRALRSAISAVRQLDYAARATESALSNTRNKENKTELTTT